MHQERAAVVSTLVGVAGICTLDNMAEPKSTKLPYRFLGSTGVKVSSLCLGTMTFGRVEEVSLSLDGSYPS